VYLPKDCDGSNKLIKKRFFASFMVATIAASSLIALSNTASAADRTVTVWTPHTRAWQVTEWKAAVARIQAANPQINIVLKTGIDMATSLKAIVANKSDGPDISVTNGNGNMGWFCAGGEGIWQKLNTMISSKRDGLNLKTTFKPSANSATISGNIRCALPMPGTEVFAFFYNKDLLAKAGYSKPPSTTAELLEYSKKLTTFDKDGNILTAGFVPKSGYYGWGMESMWLGQAFGARWYNANGSSALATDTKWVKMLNWQKKFIADVYGNGDFEKGSKALTKFNAAKGGEWGVKHDFITGRVAMKMDANWMAPLYCTGDSWALADTCKYVNMGVTGFPTDASVKATHSGSGLVGYPIAGISKTTKNVKDAWIVLKGLATDVKLSYAYDKVGGAPSPLTAAAAKPEGLPKWYEPFYAVQNHPKSIYKLMPNTGEHQDETILATLMAAWQDGAVTDLKGALEDAAGKIDQIIARNQVD
jgi:multiple sugar transport system substrate-binding protein